MCYCALKLWTVKADQRKTHCNVTTRLKLQDVTECLESQIKSQILNKVPRLVWILVPVVFKGGRDFGFKPQVYPFEIQSNSSNIKIVWGVLEKCPILDNISKQEKKKVPIQLFPLWMLHKLKGCFWHLVSPLKHSRKADAKTASFKTRRQQRKPKPTTW